MKNPLLELYSDYLISSFTLLTATVLSLLLDIVSCSFRLTSS